nr:hypothetical protein [Asanoa ferruginea]
MVIMLPWSVAPTLAVSAGVGALGVGRRAWSGAFPSPDAARRALAAEAGVAPELVAVDLHPGDPARSWAARSGLPVRAVGRHHALIAAVLAAHGVGPDEQVIGFAFDRGGYGPDGTTWGGEVLVAGYKSFRRFAHLDYVRCAGTAPDRPHRAGLAHLRHAGVRWDLDLLPVRACSNRERRVLAHQLETGYGCATTSSLGQLLDAIASLLGTATAPPDGPEVGESTARGDERRPTSGKDGRGPSTSRSAAGWDGDRSTASEDPSAPVVGRRGWRPGVGQVGDRSAASEDPSAPVVGRGGWRPGVGQVGDRSAASEDPSAPVVGRGGRRPGVGQVGDPSGLAPDASSPTVDRSAIGQTGVQTAGQGAGSATIGRDGGRPTVDRDAVTQAVAGDPYPMMGLDPGSLVRAVVEDVRGGVPAELVAGRVRATVAALVAEQARRCADETGLDVVVLAGDVFDDAALTAAATKALAGFTVLAGRPSLALGQLLCAAAG